VPGSAPTPERDDAYLSLCAEPSDDDVVASASLGMFSNAIDPTDLLGFTDTAAIYGRSRAGGALTCTEVNGSRQFNLTNPTGDPGPMRVQPVGVGADFAATLLNLVDYEELPLRIPVFSRVVINDLFDDIGLDRDLDLGTIVIEVLEPPGFFGNETRPRHAGSGFTLDAAEIVAYRVNGRWTLDAEATSDEGLAALVNVPGAPGLGRQVRVVQKEEDGDASLDRYLWTASGTITFAAMPPAL
jgi:hypothetical protein